MERVSCTSANFFLSQGDDWTMVELGLDALRRIIDHPTALPTAKMLRLKTWCEDNGSDDLYTSYISTFYFRNPADATLFRLKWA